MNHTVRVAVCQLECHPAIVVGDRDYLCEPFLPQKGQPTLADLSRHALDVSTLQADCARAYTEWHSRRLQHVLECLESFDPLPDIIVFPECSIPIHDLHSLRTFALQHKVHVFAGTHTLRLTEQDALHYDSLGISKKARKKWNTLPAGKTVLPIFTPDGTLAHIKSVPSVFEQTDITSPAGELNVLDTVSLAIRDQNVSVLPAVCAEAIQLNVPGASYHLAVILAHNNGIEPFRPTITHHAQNQVPVVFCNDGRYGESSVNVVLDQRMNGIWWWDAPLHGLLPPGDAILVVDIHLNKLAAQFGVTNPAASTHLVGILPIIADHGSASHFAVARELEDIAKQIDNTIQSRLLEGCLQQSGLSPIQKTLILQLKRLASAGTATPEWWRLIGQTCFLPSMLDLRGIEQSLAKACAAVAEEIMVSSSVDNDALLGKLARIKRECISRVGEVSDKPGAEAPDGRKSTPAALDRETETRELREFLNDKSQQVLFLTGLDDVGKDTLVSLALTQVGCPSTIWVELASDASIAFLASSLAKHVGISGDVAGTGDEIQALTTSHIVDRLPLGTVVVLSRVDNLKSHGQWRDPSSPAILAQFARELARRRSKLILVSSARVDLDNLEPSIVRRLYVRGLPKEYGLVLFDQHLRRAGLDPTNYDDDKRKRLVEDLGCHPGATILASEYVDQEGFDTVADDLRKRSGVHTRIVRRILKRLRFTEEQLTVLGLLSEARIPIPATVIGKAVSFAAIPVAQSLVQQSVVERQRHDHIVLTDLVRGFADVPRLSATTLTLFHKNAAEAFASLAQEIKKPEELVWAIESRYHAQLAGDPNLAARGLHLIDGIVGAAYRLVDTHDYERAKPIVDQLLKTERIAEVFQLGALVHARLGHCDEALALAREAFSADRTRSWIVTEVGKLSLHVRRTDIAKSCVDLVRKTGHDSPYLATLEGRILLREGDEGGALEAFQRGVQLAEAEERRRDAWPHFFLGRALLKAGKTEEAIDVLYRGEVLLSELRRPKRDLLIAIRTQLAIAYVYDNELENAKVLFDLITAEDAGSPEVIWALALYRAAAGDAGDGDQLARETLKELNPRSAKDRYGKCQVYLFRAMIYLGIGNPERASEEFSKAHHEDPRNVFVILRWAETLIQLARASNAEGEHEASRICAEHVKSLADKILEFDSDNEQARRILEQLSDEFNVL